MGTIVSKQGKQKLDHEVPKFKIVLVGEPASGKSSIFLRYTKNQFDYSYQPSISVTIGNVVKKINIPYQGVVSVIIWDVPGREEMDLRKSYYKDVDAAIVVVDVSEPDTIGLAPTWKQDVLNHANFTAKDKTSNQTGHAIIAPSIPILLLGNKSDKLEDNAKDENGSDTISSEVPTGLSELEETALKHGFIGSVAVSAKEGDGSVHAAIQILVRHLLLTRMKIKKKDVVLFNIGKKTKELDDDSEQAFLPFLSTGINELDDIFKLCEEPMTIVEQCSHKYAKVLNMFKRSCCMTDLTPSTRSTIEECIIGLKEVMMNDDGKCALKCLNDGGFVKFITLEDVMEDIPGPVSKILRLFHTKLAVAAKNILVKCSSAHEALKDYEKQLDNLVDSFEELAKSSGLSLKQQKKAWIDVEANKTRVTESRTSAMESLQAVEDDCTKIKAAMLW
ncbi:uncharacterized protein LOC114532596 [Dendronephthya gigantea]|uniref:uncharacterized protein LOC114532596 n=1 Tax=Dendronephthya gigantea TaxID=151771 RepID=UPI00106BDD2B|nr:uncharacterized protein LOC114532596 [Dendronephthya gigantea]